MGQKNKKRNKKYAGVDAAQAQPVITRVKAEERSKLRQWWLDNKRIAKPVGIASGVVVLVVWLITEMIRLASGA